ncbi:MAG: DNA-3-methyladenine glycosylase 2 family protein [Rhizobiaceae bacterium]|nr:DNA-3-methyladenine glycosylase 2 family protein [Rhizobiaceae bacterium]
MQRPAKRIDTLDDVASGLAALAGMDARLAAIIPNIGEVPLRRTEPGFASLASIIVSQQVSRASADAIFGRLVRIVDPLDAPTVLAGGNAPLVEAGLSRPKQAALLAAATAVEAGALDLHGLCDLAPEDAKAMLIAVHGVGEWTAEVYLLFAAGHPDIFPAKDLALQVAAGELFGLVERPDDRATRTLAESWSPWRAVAARLLWAHYRNLKGRDAAPTP